MQLNQSDLKAWRDTHGISKRQLAECLKCSIPMIHYIENGAKRFGPSMIARMKEVFNVEIIPHSPPKWIRDQKKKELFLPRSYNFNQEALQSPETTQEAQNVLP